ncbi:hypothetical protein CDAR_583151 [Caerostris darwini]|uniref:Uncharacterized protein n=1 Tax=Caerostris darwini TaxID=1538125 RepID=A0AAV4P828_9ARAC|nr:hypothetical protein CDAR_583151 [Caerostris darwini]
MSNVTSEAVGNASLLHDSPIQKPVDLPVLPMERRVSNGRANKGAQLSERPIFFSFPCTPRYPLTGPFPQPDRVDIRKTPTTCRITVLVLPFICITFVLMARDVAILVLGSLT